MDDGQDGLPRVRFGRCEQARCGLLRKVAGSVLELAKGHCSLFVGVLEYRGQGCRAETEARWLRFRDCKAPPQVHVTRSA
jgi:hypothetical protein